MKAYLLNLTDEQHKRIKLLAFQEGLTIKQYILTKTIKGELK